MALLEGGFDLLPVVEGAFELLGACRCSKALRSCSCPGRASVQIDFAF